MDIECRICNLEINTKGLSNHLRGKHSISFSEYLKDNLEQFPSYHICPICEKNITTGTCCSRKCISNWKSTSYKGRKGWSKGLTKKDHPGLKRMAEKAKIRGKGVNIWDRMSDKTKKEAKRKMSYKAKGRVNPMLEKTHTPETIHKIFSHKRMTSDEKIVSDFLKKHNIPFYFQFFISDKSTHSYDFKLKNSNIIVEVDGDYWHGGPGVKKHFFDVKKTQENDLIKEKIATSKGLEVVRFWGSDLKKDASILNKLIK